MRFFMMKSLILLIFAGVLSRDLMGCGAHLIGEERGKALEGAPDQSGVARREGAGREPSVEGDKQMSKNDLANLREQLVALIDSLLSQPPHRGRSPRSTTVGTFSEYFGSLNAGAYGNCTCRGDPGPTGPAGIPGRDGRDGRDAPPACHDAVRPATTQSLPTASSDGNPGTNFSPGGSTSANGVYVRWGRTECREGSDLVYEGVIAGSHYTKSGGGSNQLCLPLDPIYDLIIPGTQSWTLIYGAEYEISGAPEAAWNALHDQGPPCAVCLALQRPTVLMIPARNICPSSWILEYSGQLMAEHHNHQRSEFICVDRHPETIPGTSSGANGALLYLVETACDQGNSLPCGPYIQGNELTCAVCSM